MNAFALTAFRCAVVLSAVLLLDAAPASAQRAPSSQKAAPPQQAATEPPTPAPEPSKPENPGLLNEIGKLLVKPADLFPTLKLPDAAPPGLATTQPGDTSTVPAPPAIALPAPPASPPAPAAPLTPSPPTVATAPATAKPSAALVPQVIRGRASCPTSSNGAPDCKAGADKLCKDKGFSGGSSLDMDSARTCSTKALLEGARHIRDICKTENFVTRAMCQ